MTTAGPSAPPERLRLDKWLWHARFVKTRALAAQLCAGGAIRSAGLPITKPAYPVRIGDVLTFALAGHVRVVKVLALGVRRGPACEARALYQDLAPPSPETRIAD